MIRRIFFRVDGNNLIGLGHLVRCIALADMLKAQFEISFFCNTIPPGVSGEIQLQSFELVEIKKEAEFLKRLMPGIIAVLDHYGLGSDYQQLIKNSGAKLVVIDDLHNKTMYADLIINHSPGITASDYQAQHYCQFSLGLDYALLRAPFLKKVKRKASEGLRNAFVCFGGSDVQNLTLMVANILKEFPHFRQINIVVGESYPFVTSLKESAETDIRFKIHQAIGAAQLSNLIKISHLSIVPSSGILMEALSVGHAIISGMYIENQSVIYSQFKKINAFIDAGNFDRQSTMGAIEYSLSLKNTRPENLIDGKSGERLLNTFRQLAREDLISIRPLAENDLSKTFEWANSPQVREFSFNKSPIEYESHKRWFMEKIKDETCFFFLAEMGQIPIGSIRFDLNNSSARISYLVDPEYHKEGIGTTLLKKGLQTFLNSIRMSPLTVFGEVLPENVGSIRVFKKLGYQQLIDNSKPYLTFIKRIR